MESELSELQRKKVEILTDKIMEMNMHQLRYLATVIREDIFKTSGINPFKINVDWPELKQHDIGTWPPTNPNWFK